MWQQFLNGILGIWTVVAAYIYMSSGTGRTLLIITGVLVAILGFWGGSVESMEDSRQHPRGAA